MTTEELGAWVWQNMSGMFTDAQHRNRVLSESVHSDVDLVFMPGRDFVMYDHAAEFHALLDRVREWRFDQLGRFDSCGESDLPH